MALALVIGLGQSGLAMARWLARAGWTVRVADTRAQPPMLGALRDALPQAQFVAGPLGAVPGAAPGAAPEALLEGVDLVAVSPGLAPRAEPLRTLLAAAAERALDVVGEIELFARALADLLRERAYAPQLIGVTGTNGKTTTVRMAGAMLSRWGRSVVVAGNISPSALDALRAADETGQLPDFWVLELSSFQLAGARSLVCTAAAVLNITEDHLDWHEDFDDYAASKARIFAPSTLRVVNRDDPRTRALALAGGSAAASSTSFGAAAPGAPGQYGLVQEGGLTWLAWAPMQESALARRPSRSRAAGASDAPAQASAGNPAGNPAGTLAGTLAGTPAGSAAGTPADALAGAAASLTIERLMPVDALAVRGTHNAMNALAALALVRAVGCPLAPALHALGQYAGEPHRTQTVATIGGVAYVDDSKGTNVGATLAAVRGLAGAADPASGDARRIVLILGGDGKGQSFAPLAEAVAAHVRAVLLIGRDGPLIGAALADCGVPLHPAADLTAAVHAAAGLARPGDTVLLSPACASFDAFRDYAHRAQVFADAVGALEGHA